MEGIAAVKGKGDWWVANHEVHSSKVEGPFPHGDRFIVRFTYDVTAKGGPMAGKRFTMDEAGLYTVKDGKVSTKSFSIRWVVKDRSGTCPSLQKFVLSGTSVAAHGVPLRDDIKSREVDGSN